MFNIVNGKSNRLWEMGILAFPWRNLLPKLMKCNMRFTESPFFTMIYLKDSFRCLTKGNNQLKKDELKAPVTALTEVNIDTVSAIVRENRRLTLWVLSKIQQISLGASYTLVTEKLNFWRVCVWWVQDSWYRNNRT